MYRTLSGRPKKSTKKKRGGGSFFFHLDLEYEKACSCAIPHFVMDPPQHPKFTPTRKRTRAVDPTDRIILRKNESWRKNAKNIHMMNTKYSILIHIGLLPGETGRAAYAKFQKKGERGARGEGGGEINRHSTDRVAKAVGRSAGGGRGETLGARRTRETVGGRREGTPRSRKPSAREPCRTLRRER